VLVFSDQTLLADGVEDVLRQEAGVEILGRETDPVHALQSIAQIHPDVVILAGPKAAEEFASAVMAFLQREPAVKIVEVALESNTLHIYGKEVRMVREVRGLLEVIEQHSVHGDEGLAVASGDLGGVVESGTIGLSAI
jgi:chemotaxis response regulator CheB